DLPIFAAEPDLTDKWRGRLDDEGFKVGISWQGNPNHRLDHLRSPPLSVFAPIGGIPGGRLISLQAQNGLHQLEHLPAGMQVESLGDEVTDNPRGFHEIAGVVANLDLVITCDNGLAHFAGALNHRQWIAVRDRADWRWGHEGERSPWYPNMRIFRQ